MAKPDVFVTVKPRQPSWIQNIRHLFKSNSIWMYGSLAVVLFVGAIIGTSIRNHQTITSKATVGSARISILPALQTMPPDSYFQIWLTTDVPVTESHIEIQYDPKLLQITQEPHFTNASMTKILETTPFTDANYTGRMFLATGLEKNQTAGAPIGTFLFATLKFTSISNAPDATTTISINTSNSTITQGDLNALQITAEDTKLILNPSLDE